jgi:hypothetical protein
VIGEILQLGDLAFAFDPSGVAGGERLDQPPHVAADLEGEVGS